MITGYMAYSLTPESQAEVQKRFPAKFAIVHSDHVTIAFNVTEFFLPVASLEVIGYACSEEIECLVVRVNGSINRSIGGIFHITLSHIEGVFPVKSNKILVDGFTPITPFSILGPPKFFPFTEKRD